MASELTKLLEKDEKTTSRRIYDSLVKSDKGGLMSERIFGIKTVKDQLIDAMYRASFVASQGYVPIVVLAGPSGSGKTELINFAISSYTKLIREGGENEQIHTLKIKGNRCPHNESIYGVLSDSLPFRINLNDANVGNTISGRKQLCASCAKGLEQLIGEANEVDIDNGEITTEKVFPSLVNLRLSDSSLANNFYTIVNNANRGILLISADKTEMSSITDEHIQFLSSLFDNNITNKLGEKVPLDMLVILHGNEKFIPEYKSDESANSNPLLDRFITVNVRRNLSYSEELRMYRSMKIPIKEGFPDAMKYVSMINVFSRIDDSYTDRDISANNNLLGLLDIYDSGRQVNFNELSKSMQEYIAGGDKKSSMDKRRIFEQAAKSLIYYPDSDGQIRISSGWSTGVSSRKIVHLLNSIDDKELNISDFERYLNEVSVEELSGVNEDKRRYVEDMIMSDIKTHIDYSKLQYSLRTEDDSPDHYIRLLEKHLSTAKTGQKKGIGYTLKSEAVEKADLDKLENHVDIKILEDIIEGYQDEEWPVSKAFLPRFIDVMRYCHRKSTSDANGAELIKNYTFREDDLYDEKSELHKYVKDRMKSDFGYSEKSAKEAIKIYREGYDYDY